MASALLTRTLQILQADGCREAQLLVDGDSPSGAGRLYRSHGFTELDQSITWVLELPPTRPGTRVPGAPD